MIINEVSVLPGNRATVPGDGDSAREQNRMILNSLEWLSHGSNTELGLLGCIVASAPDKESVRSKHVI